MNVISPESLKQCEEELIETIKDEINFKDLSEILKSRLNEAKLECTDGDIIVHENKVAYKLNLQINISSEVLLDREGNLLSSPDSEELSEGLSDDSEKLEVLEEEIAETSPVEPPSEEMDISEMVNKGNDEDMSDDNKPLNHESNVDDILEDNREFWKEKVKS